MNSISYLDSVLTRSLTSSRHASGSTTPTKEEEGDGHRLNRRASDYSLSRERDRERRRIALSLGLSALDADQEPVKRKKSSKSSKSSSKRSSRQGSTKGSETESTFERRSSDRFTGSGHPKSSSESKTGDIRRRLNRTGSTPAPIRSLSSSSTKWGGLWGLGGWLDGSESHDSYSRRGLSSSYDGFGKSMMRKGSSSKESKGTRRASTSDVDAAFMSVSPESLLSERERENVVDFEGYDPEEDLHPLSGSNAPPSTPYPSTTATTTPTKERPRREGSGMSTGSRISSLLFGALNPLTDDYFGPQPTTTPTPPQQRRKKSEDGTISAERKRQKSQKVQDSPTKTTSEKSAILLNITGKEEAETSRDVSGHLPSEPPPPYSDVASIVSSTNSLLLPSPDLDELRSKKNAKGIRRRRAAALVLRGVRATLEFLRRLVLAILLAPVRITYYYRRRNRSPAAIPVEVQEESKVKRRDSAGKFQTSSQAERPSAARHVAGRRPSSKRFDDDEGSSSEEVITEDQAEERARRKAAKIEAAKAATAASVAATIAEEEAAVERKTSEQASKTLLITPGGSRLLPNPNPIDPLLAHDRNAKPSDNLIQAVVPMTKAPSPAMIANRGPLSSLIHHSPKVLVLDLDETLIHSTSRSPTWGALTDKSKGRMAVTAGGSLLGLEGVGGMMGLRGQVGVRPHQVEVVLDGRSIIYHVYKRPHVDHFLRKVAAWYHVVIFTASVQEYADPVIDWLDQGRGLVGTRLFRESCTFRNGSYLKNLAHVDADLSRVCLVDNSPASYMINQTNGIPIEGWTHDPNDECLLDLLPVLDSLRFASDVRHILGLRGFLDTKHQNTVAKRN